MPNKSPIAFFYADTAYSPAAIHSVYSFLSFARKHPRLGGHLERVRLIVSFPDLLKIEAPCPVFIEHLTLFELVAKQSFAAHAGMHRWKKLHIPFYSHNDRAMDQIKMLNLDTKNSGEHHIHYEPLSNAAIATPIEAYLQRL